MADWQVVISMRLQLVWKRCFSRNTWNIGSFPPPTWDGIDYLVEAILEINDRKKELSGFEIVEAPPFLRHFTAKFKPV
jgi:hypothetical protein